MDDEPGRSPMRPSRLAAPTTPSRQPSDGSQASLGSPGASPSWRRRKALMNLNAFNAFRTGARPPQESQVAKTSTWAFPGRLFAEDVPEHLREELPRNRVWRSSSEPLVEALVPLLVKSFEEDAFAHKVPHDELFHRGGASGSASNMGRKEQQDRLDMIRDHLELLGSLGHATSVYTGYVDDPRCTDNAWIETVAIHVHCPFDLGAQLKLAPGVDVDDATWIDVDHLQSAGVPLYASHIDWLERVSTRMDRRNTSLTSILVRWGRLDVAERVLPELDPELRQVRCTRPPSPPRRPYLFSASLSSLLLVLPLLAPSLPLP